MISENMTLWAGKPVVDWSPDIGITDPANTAYRLRVGFEDDCPPWKDIFAAFMYDPRIGDLEALVIGSWDMDSGQDDSSEVVEGLVAASVRIPHLTALFLWDITYIENEMSWIQQSDISPLFGAFPKLEQLGIRGSARLSLGIPCHSTLKTLIIESGGLPNSVIAEVTGAELPSLEHLELWLGNEDYGAEATIEDLQAIFEGNNRWPKLRYLGLCNSEITDEIAIAIAKAPILPQLEVLDLSLGTLGDEGVAALAESQGIAQLKRLDIHHHYVSDEGVDRLKALGPEVNARDAQKEEEIAGEMLRFVSVGE